MANSEHLVITPNEEHRAKLREGPEAWNRWRKEHVNVLPNLRLADLRAANLGGADLTWVNLVEADLYRANLLGANLVYANVGGAKLARPRPTWT